MKNAPVPVSNFVVDTTAVQLRIKEIIKEDVLSNVAEAETKRKVKEEIYGYIKGIQDPILRAEAERSLSLSFAQWYRNFVLGMQTIQRFIDTNEEIIRAAAKHLPKGESFAGVAFNEPIRGKYVQLDKGIAIVQDYEKRVAAAYQNLIQDMARSEALVQKGISLRNIAEIEVRRQEQEEEISNLKADGVNIVWASSHADCSERCEPWQGELYSLDGTYGVIDNIRYIPLEIARRGTKGDGNGLLGYNCRHRLIPYRKGLTPPKEYTSKEIRKQRAIDKKQRYMERRIRQTKQEAFLLRGVDSQKSKELFEKARVMDSFYRQYSEDNGRASYLWRTQVRKQEIELIKGGNNVLRLNT